MIATAGHDLLQIFQSALQRVNGAMAVRLALADEEFVSPLCLIAVGKAAAAMTDGALEVLGDTVVSGLVITKHGHLDASRLNDRRFQLIEADHPIPGAASLAAGQALIAYCEALTPQVQVLALISGGASSLVESLPAGFSLQDLQSLTALLLGSGLDITAVNRIRQQVSQIKGGKLLRYLEGHEILVLAISDVPGDDPAMIGSGLFYPTEYAGEVAWPKAALPYRKVLDQTIPPQKAAVCPRHRIIANLETAKQAAAARARGMGLTVFVHRRFLEGDVMQVAEELACYLSSAEAGVHIWGGETTAMLPAQPGKGGRNQHLGLCIARSIAGNQALTVLTAGTDGTDGPTGDAGALVDGGTLKRGEEAGFDIDASIKAFDSGRFLEASGDLVTTGPTGTNVMDLVIARVAPS